jgi:hypothetical protein
MFAAAHHNDTQILWVILAILCFIVAIYLAAVRNYIGMAGAAFIGVVVIVLAVQ